MSNKIIVLNLQKQVTYYTSHITHFTGKPDNWLTKLNGRPEYWWDFRLN